MQKGHGVFSPKLSIRRDNQSQLLLLENGEGSDNETSMETDSAEPDGRTQPIVIRPIDDATGTRVERSKSR